MAKKNNIYKCKVCGYEMVGFMGKCPECSSFGSFEEVTKNEITGKKRSTGVTQKLKEVQSTNSLRVITSVNEFDRVMGGGIVKDSVTILTAKPGAGKSTLLLQVANRIAEMGLDVLYASGEESASQIKSRADRILKNISDGLHVMSDNSLDNVIEEINRTNPDFIIVDSIQTFTLEAYQPSRAGSPTQTMECAYELVRIAKDNKSPKIVFIVGQMTKDDELAGVRALEHLVDTVLIIEGESGEELRSLMSTKNRYGSTGEMGFFNMTEDGMESIDNPSEYFMTSREENNKVNGVCLTVVREGTRPIILEIESLVSQSFTPYPSRIGEAMKREQLNTLVSILEQRGGLSLYDKNVVIKTTGGIRLKEHASNLAVIMSIVSSAYERPIPTDSVFLADVGLTGELKKVPSLDARIREAERLGFKKAYIGSDYNNNRTYKDIILIKSKSLKEVINKVFSK